MVSFYSFMFYCYLVTLVTFLAYLSQDISFNRCLFPPGRVAILRYLWIVVGVGQSIGGLLITNVITEFAEGCTCPVFEEASMVAMLFDGLSLAASVLQV